VNSNKNFLFLSFFFIVVVENDGVVGKSSSAGCVRRL
jgi:hypothetical protein